MTRHVVARAGDIGPGEHRIVGVAGRSIGIFNVAGEYYALLNRCPHGGAELCKGRVTGLVAWGEGGYRSVRDGEFLRCPWHGWEFEIATGKSYCTPDRVKARKLPVEVAPGAELVEGPYVAETFEVTREGEYLVVTI